MKVLGAPELLEKISVLVEDDDSHDLALHYDDPAHSVHADAARVLQDVGSKLTDELAILRVDLHLEIKAIIKSGN